MSAEAGATAAIILAAGASTRMGRPKQLLPIGGKTLLGHTQETVLATPRISQVFVVLGAHARETRAALSTHRTRIVLNPAWAQGLSTSLQAGLQAALAWQPHLTAVVFTLADQPFLTPDALSRMIERGNSTPPAPKLVTAFYDGHPGAPCWARAAVFDAITRLTGDHGLRPLFETFSPPEIAHVRLPELATDLDTCEDYQRFIERNRAAPAPPVQDA